MSEASSDPHASTVVPSEEVPSGSVSATASADGLGRRKKQPPCFGHLVDKVISTPTRRNYLRRVFLALTLTISVLTVALLIAFNREIDREEAKSLQPATAVPGIPPTPVPYETKSWKERYELLGKDIFGSDFKAAVDVFFAIQLLASIVGLVGGVRRTGSFIWLSLFLLFIVWIMCIVILSGLHNHVHYEDKIEGHEGARKRYAWAFAWAYLEILFFLPVTMAVGWMIAIRVKLHKTDRFAYSSASHRRVASPVTRGATVTFSDRNVEANRVDPLTEKDVQRASALSESNSPPQGGEGLDTSLLGEGAIGPSQQPVPDSPVIQYREWPGQRTTKPVIRVSDYTTDGSGPPNRRISAGGVEEA